MIVIKTCIRISYLVNTGGPPGRLMVLKMSAGKNASARTMYHHKQSLSLVPSPEHAQTHHCTMTQICVLFNNPSGHVLVTAGAHSCHFATQSNDCKWWPRYAYSTDAAMTGCWGRLPNLAWMHKEIKRCPDQRHHDTDIGVLLGSANCSQAPVSQICAEWMLSYLEIC